MQEPLSLEVEGYANYDGMCHTVANVVAYVSFIIGTNRLTSSICYGSIKRIGRKI